MTTIRLRPRCGRSQGRALRLTAVVLAAFVLVLVLVPACSPKKKGQGGQAGPGGPGGPQGPVPVTAASATVQDVPVSIKAIGTVEAYNTVKVRARVGGELIRVGFEEGKDVREGSLLFTVDPRPYQVALQSAQADSARDAAKAASTAALMQRYADLIQKDYITKQEFDQAKADAASNQATVLADEAACANARLNLSFCYIRSPISGRTGSVLVRRGNLVAANDPNPLVVIQQIHPVYVSFSVPEQQLPQIRDQAAGGSLAVSVSSSADTTRTYLGELSLIDNTVDPTTGTILLKGKFDNEDEALWPGEFVDVALTVATRRGAVVVPAPAIQKGQSGSFVYLIKPDNTVAMQPVVVGPNAGRDRVVVDKGLNGGDRVVTDGQLRLTPGARVDIKPGRNLGTAGETAAQ